MRGCRFFFSHLPRETFEEFTDDDIGRAVEKPSAHRRGSSTYSNGVIINETCAAFRSGQTNDTAAGRGAQGARQRSGEACGMGLIKVG